MDLWSLRQSLLMIEITNNLCKIFEIVFNIGNGLLICLLTLFELHRINLYKEKLGIARNREWEKERVWEIEKEGEKEIKTERQKERKKERDREKERERERIQREINKERHNMISSSCWIRILSAWEIFRFYLLTWDT